MDGNMTVQILNYLDAQSSYLLDKTWKSAIPEPIENVQLDIRERPS